MPTPPPDPEEIDESTKQAVERARDLLAKWKLVQQHENAVLADEDEPPLFKRG
jgi:hypothetical protein